jgi:hypothetical protein
MGSRAINNNNNNANNSVEFKVGDQFFIRQKSVQNIFQPTTYIVASFFRN